MAILAQPSLVRTPLALIFVLFLASSANAQSTTRVSVKTGGTEAITGGSSTPALSADGRFVAFESQAYDLVSGDTNNATDIFVHDRQSVVTTRVSVASGGGQSDSVSIRPALSADGRYVAFDSVATNLVPGDTNGWSDVFVHDRQTGVTTRVSVDSAGGQGSDASYRAAISGDGRYVAFESFSPNLVANDLNGQYDVFVHDRQTGVTTRVSVTSGGAEASGGGSGGPSISADGRYVSFESGAVNLAPGDLNGTYDIFVHDRQTGATERVSVASGGTEANNFSINGALSADGAVVAFESYASNLVGGDTNGVPDIFTHVRASGVTTRVSVDSLGAQGNGFSTVPAISGDGRVVGFESGSDNLVAGDTNFYGDVFVHDRQTGATSRVSVDSLGAEANAWSADAAITPDGRYVCFFSLAWNLVPGDNNFWNDVFLRDRGGPTGPALALTGNCPGSVTFTISGATAGGTVVLLSGSAGVFVKPTPPCQGITLGLRPPTLRGTFTANGSGGVQVTANIPGAACGQTVQAVDAASCTPTNAMVL